MSDWNRKPFRNQAQYLEPIWVRLIPPALTQVILLQIPPVLMSAVSPRKDAFTPKEVQMSENYVIKTCLLALDRFLVSAILWTCLCSVGNDIPRWNGRCMWNSAAAVFCKSDITFSWNVIFFWATVIPVLTGKVCGLEEPLFCDMCLPALH